MAAVDALANYIEDVSKNQEHRVVGRLWCDVCKKNRYLYCPHCAKMMSPREIWPSAIRDQELRLPFALDIILDDRRTSSTGVQVTTILRAAESTASSEEGIEDKNVNSNIPTPSYRLIGIDAGDPVPNYSEEMEDGNEGVYILFPDPSSVPLSHVLHQSGEIGESQRSYAPIKRLVVLDCKWRQSRIRTHPNLECLPRIHLDGSPKQSFFWRWHNAGEGMLSTIEAVYYAAWQTADQFGWDLQQKQHLVSLFWLFAVQRHLISQSYESGKNLEHPAPVPFSNDGKEYHRALRRQQNKKYLLT